LRLPPRLAGRRSLDQLVFARCSGVAGFCRHSHRFAIRVPSNPPCPALRAFQRLARGLDQLVCAN
jgi:hypothetical protein